MAVTYDTTFVFCTQNDVEDAGGRKRDLFDSLTGPTEDQVYEFVRGVASVIVGATQRWGLRIEPGGTNDAWLAEQLEKANASGAAGKAWLWRFQQTGVEADKDAANAAFLDYEGFMGEGSSNEGTSAGVGEGGSIETAILAAQGIGVTASHATEGGNTFADIDGRLNIEPDHLMTDDN